MMKFIVACAQAKYILGKHKIYFKAVLRHLVYRELRRNSYH